MKNFLQCNSVFVRVLSAEYMRECTFNPAKNHTCACFHCEISLVRGIEEFYGQEHGLFSCKDTKTKCRLYVCLIEFIDWRYSQSCWYFLPSFVNYCVPLYSNLLSGSPPPLPPSQSKRQRVAGKGCWVVLETICFRSLPLCFRPDSESTKLLFHPKHKLKRGGGLRQINTMPQSPYTGKLFLYNDIWRCFLSV